MDRMLDPKLANVKYGALVHLKRPKLRAQIKLYLLMFICFPQFLNLDFFFFTLDRFKDNYIYIYL